MLKRNKTEMEKEDYIWGRKMYFFQRRTKPGKKNEEYIWRWKIFFAGEKINSRGKGGIIGEGKYVFCGGKE